MFISTFRKFLAVSSIVAIAGLSVFSLTSVQVEAAEVTHQFTVTNNLIPRDLGNPAYVYDGVLAVCSDPEPFGGDAVVELARLNPGESFTFSVTDNNDLRKFVYFDSFVNLNVDNQCYGILGSSFPAIDLDLYSEPHQFNLRMEGSGNFRYRDNLIGEDQPTVTNVTGIYGESSTNPLWFCIDGVPQSLSYSDDIFGTGTEYRYYQLAPGTYTLSYSTSNGCSTNPDEIETVTITENNVRLLTQTGAIAGEQLPWAYLETDNIIPLGDTQNPTPAPIPTSPSKPSGLIRTGGQGIGQ